MKFIHATEGTTHMLELSRRNLETLLAKLDDPHSQRTLIKQEDVGVGDHFIMVRAVEDHEHYSDRAPGEVYMPSTGATL